ncbi:Cytochrome P450 52A1 [Colletotrichum trifolii]|uniref:Cytochrome P450 52A1 n=1 Tax=Colletotrichum trifolii TaxID=5466 RepID=A0A4R8QSI9_COLTR|nr:Cytochrome P450 52A1 [Colletotrichum trifolii]
MQPSIEKATCSTAAKLDEMDKTDRGWSLLHACAAIVAILIAGRDTTVTTMAWTFYELARNPETLVELRREIASAVGVGAEAREPTYKDLKSMTFVSHVLRETLRLLPNTPFNIRAAPKDTS